MATSRRPESLWVPSNSWPSWPCCAPGAPPGSPLPPDHGPVAAPCPGPQPRSGLHPEFERRVDREDLHAAGRPGPGSDGGHPGDAVHGHAPGRQLEKARARSQAPQPGQPPARAASPEYPGAAGRRWSCCRCLVRPCISWCGTISMPSFRCPSRASRGRRPSGQFHSDADVEGVVRIPDLRGRGSAPPEAPVPEGPAHEQAGNPRRTQGSGRQSVDETAHPALAARPWRAAA